MKELKFRQAILGKDGNFKSWLYWGFIEENGFLMFAGPDTHYSGIKGALKNSQQYTSLKDKNGVEIYEGDVVNYPYSHGDIYPMKVVWLKHGWYITDETIYCCPSEWREQEAEVIGNIYENPELLEVKA